MKQLLLLAIIWCAPACAAEITLVIPPLAKGRWSAEGDALRARYDAMWARYAEEAAVVERKVIAALEIEFNAAADAGDLDLAEMWDRKKKTFAETKTVTWDVAGKPKADARKKPKDDASRDFGAFLQASQRTIDDAVAALKRDYDSLVKDYTKARNLERAKQLRDESQALGDKPAGQAGRPRMVADEPDRKPAAQRTGADLQRALVGTAWKNQNGFTFEWDASGALWHCKDGTRAPIKISYDDGTRCSVEFVNKARQVLVFKNDLSAFEQYGLDGKLLQSAIRLR